MTRATPMLAGATWLVAVAAVGISAAVAPDVVFDGAASAMVVVCFVFTTSGALVAYRTGGNAVGWLLVGIGALVAVTITGQAGASWIGPGFMRDLAYWTGVMAWAPLVALLLALTAVFPTGRVVRGWPRLHVWAALGFVVGAILLNGFVPSLEEEAGVPNPFANPDLHRWGERVAPVVLVSMVTLLVFGAASLFVRYRRGSSMERQQIKWFIFGAALLPPAFALADVTQTTVGPAILGAAALAFPTAIAVAILKHRLYDIDRIINRTVVYAIVVGLLAVVFAAGAVWIPSLLPFNDNLAVAASTLAVAALFNPLRKRVQRFVDRRFYRSRYDTQRVAEAFSARLRDQMDPDVVAAEWAGVVQRTLQPSSVAVWVREGS